jgi:hypothetical protein
LVQHRAVTAAVLVTSGSPVTCHFTAAASAISQSGYC